MSAIPVFQTDRLILRGVTLNDASSYAKHFIDYEVVRFLSKSIPWPYPEDGIKNYLKEVVLPRQGKGKWVWGIFLKVNPEELIGVVDLWRQGRPEHRGFWLGKKFWGMGIMTEAVIPITDYAFSSLGFEKLVFANAKGNIASRRVKEKTGCTCIGTRTYQFVDPQLTESELWELSRESWEVFRSVS